MAKRREKMKKMMLAAVVAVVMAMGVYAADEAKAPAKADAKAAEVKVCADCAKIEANKGLKPGDAKFTLCPACKKIADEAAKKAAAPAAK